MSYDKWLRKTLRCYKARYRLRDNPLLGDVVLPEWSGWRDAYEDDLTPSEAVDACAADFVAYGPEEDEEEL